MSYIVTEIRSNFNILQWTFFLKFWILAVLFVALLQVPLSTVLKKQICEDIRDLPDLCATIYNLDIAISFLKTTGGKPDTNLYEYMFKTLQIERPLASLKVILIKALVCCCSTSMVSFWPLINRLVSIFVGRFVCKSLVYMTVLS